MSRYAIFFISLPLLLRLFLRFDAIAMLIWRHAADSIHAFDFSLLDVSLIFRRYAAIVDALLPYMITLILSPRYFRYAIWFSFRH